MDALDTPDHDAVLSAISTVMDPEAGMNVVDLGLIYGVDIDEGTVDENFDGRKWEVEVQPGQEIIQTTREDRRREKAEQKREQEESDQTAVIEALAKLGRGEGAFPRKLRALTGLANNRLERTVMLLIEQKIVEPCEALQAPSHKLPKPGAFRLTKAWWDAD